MKFKSICFDNYRCFLDGKIEFPTTSEKNMTVLIAPNGGGKTETLFAFWWTLYDFDFSKLTNKENTPYPLNSEAHRRLEQSEEGATDSCSVVLTFEHENVIYEITKKCEYRKTEKQIRTEEYRTFRYYKENGELSLPLRDTEEIYKKLNRIIPKQILYGIVFDGERMQKLSTPNESSVNAIKGVINDITNVELLEKCNQYFESIKRKLNKEFKKVEKKAGNTSVEELIIEINDTELEKNEKERQLINAKDDLNNTKSRLSQISEALSKNNEVKEIERQRKDEREKLSIQEKLLDTYYKSFSDTLVDSYLFASEKLFEDVEDIIDNYDVPEGLTVKAVESIINNSHGKCICGKELDEKAINTLKTLIGLLPPDNINSTLKEIIRGLKLRKEEVKRDAKEIYLNIKDTESNIKKIKENIASLSMRISSLNSDGDDVAEAIRLEEENVKLTKDEARLEVKIPELENRIKELDANLSKLTAQRNAKSLNSDISKNLNKQISFVEKSILALSKIKDVNKITALNEINKRLSLAYETLSEDFERGRQIRIIQYIPSKKFQLAVFMKDNYDKLMEKWKASGKYQEKLLAGISEDEIEEEVIVRCIDSNSTGQSKINTFAFVKAILDYSNTPKNDDGIEITKDYPLLIDAPFGDIAAGNLHKSSTQLHTFANQVILMIDEDKYEALREAFDPYINNKYYFDKAAGSNYSSIRKVSD